MTTFRNNILHPPPILEVWQKGCRDHYVHPINLVVTPVVAISLYLLPEVKDQPNICCTTLSLPSRCLALQPKLSQPSIIEKIQVRSFFLFIILSHTLRSMCAPSFLITTIARQQMVPVDNRDVVEQPAGCNTYSARIIEPFLNSTK